MEQDRQQSLIGDDPAADDKQKLHDYTMRLVERTIEAAGPELLSRSSSVRQELLIDLANMPGGENGPNWFSRIWGQKLRPEDAQELIGLRDELRRIWELNNAVRLHYITWRSGGVESNCPPVLAANEILNKWLSWRPSREQEEGYDASESQKRQEGTPEEQLLRHLSPEHRYEASQWLLPEGYVPFSCWLPMRSLIPDTRSLRPMLIQGVFENWDHFMYCANSVCATPYFIAKRKDQVVCNAEICKAERQRQHVLKWWNENRAQKNQKQGKPVGKLTKREKGSGKNVTRKAR